MEHPTLAVKLLTVSRIGSDLMVGMILWFCEGISSVHTSLVQSADWNSVACELFGYEYLQVPEEFYLTTVFFISSLVLLRGYLTGLPIGRASSHSLISTLTQYFFPNLNLITPLLKNLHRFPYLLLGPKV